MTVVSATVGHFDLPKAVAGVAAALFGQIDERRQKLESFVGRAVEQKGTQFVLSFRLSLTVAGIREKVFGKRHHYSVV